MMPATPHPRRCTKAERFTESYRARQSPNEDRGTALALPRALTAALSSWHASPAPWGLSGYHSPHSQPHIPSGQKPDCLSHKVVFKPPPPCPSALGLLASPSGRESLRSRDRSQETSCFGGNAIRWHQDLVAPCIHPTRFPPWSCKQFGARAVRLQERGPRCLPGSLGATVMRGP